MSTSSSSRNRSATTKTRNNEPCVHCRKHRQRCDGGYPCHFCTKFHRKGCVRVEPSAHRGRNRATSEVSTLDDSTPSPPGPANSNLQPDNQQYFTDPAENSQHPIEFRSQGFNRKGILGPYGEITGFIESFVHTDNGRLYYGARYYDANQELVQEDTLLARVREDDGFNFFGVANPAPSDAGMVFDSSTMQEYQYSSLSNNWSSVTY